MATAGIIQRRDIKSALIAGQPSAGSGGDWSGPVLEGELVYATDTKEIGYIDSTGNLKWVSIDNVGERELPLGGTTGQVLLKNSNTDGDISWGTINISQEFVKDGNGYRISGLSTDTLGTNAVNLGTCSTASGDYSFVSGYCSTAEGKYAVSLNSRNYAIGDYSTTEGYTTVSGRGIPHDSFNVNTSTKVITVLDPVYLPWGYR